MKKRNIWFYPFILLGMLVVLISSCKKADNSGSNAYNGKTNAVFNSSLIYSTMTDQDGNIYKTIKIGTQTWMAENLRTTKYNDGTAIPNVTDGKAWTALTTPAYSWYNNDATVYEAIYGALYNWYTVNTGKLSPTGWHIPNDDEWTTLITFLGDENVAGGKLKEIGTTHWITPNTEADNRSGFTALPGGYRHIGGSFDYIGYSAAWWSSTAGNTDDAYTRFLGNNYNFVYSYTNNVGNGFSVRCVKDN